MMMHKSISRFPCHGVGAKTKANALGWFLLGCGLVAGFGPGCGGSETDPATPNNVPPGGSYPAASYSAYPTASYPATSASTPLSSAAPSASANPIAPIEPALQQTALAILNEVALREAPGAKPVGETRVALLGTNQTVEQLITLKPGKCYTAISVGMLPINEVNIQILPETTVPGANLVLAQDQTQGPQAILGQGQNCFKWALSVEGRVRVVTTVAVGAGLLGAQVYEK
jgi:hypothetical protein